MLATRGAVYHTEDTASFRPHRGCHCTVEPLFGLSYEPPAHIRRAQAVWAENGSLADFRRAIDAERN